MARFTGTTAIDASRLARSLGVPFHVEKQLVVIYCWVIARATTIVAVTFAACHAPGGIRGNRSNNQEARMSYADSNGVKLYVEETGTGYPLVFVHEFAADHREWEPQVRYFARHYRCITYAARGYPPSDVPEEDATYHYTHFADDIAAVVRHAGASKAHVVGLSQGAYATLMFGLRHPEMASALVAAGVGSGSVKEQGEEFRKQCEVNSQRFLQEGS